MLWFKCKIALQLVVLFWNSMSLLEHGTWGLQASSTPCLCFWLEVLLPDLLGWQQAASCSHWCRQEVVLGHIFPAMRDVFPEQRSIINPSSLASYLAQGRNGTWQTDPPPNLFTIPNPNRKQCRPNYFDKLSDVWLWEVPGSFHM